MSNNLRSSANVEEAARKALAGAENVGLFGHERPDGDCVGAVVAVAIWLRRLGKRTQVFLPGGVPERYFFLSGGLGLAVNPAASAKLDLACAIDTANLERLGEYRKQFEMAPVKMVIDHHPDNSIPADMRWVEEKVSSGAELIFRLIGEEELKNCGERAAFALYTGLVTDTGRFSYSNTTPEALAQAGKLVGMGARPATLTDLLYRSRRAEELLIEGEFLSSLRVYEGGRVLVMSVSNDFMKRFPEISVEDLAARTIEVKGVLVGVMLLEIQPGVVKISLRARDGIDVGAVARKIGGGGHFPASGAKMSGTVESVEAAVLKAIQGALNEADETGRNT